MKTRSADVEDEVIVGTIDDCLAFDAYHCNGTRTVAAVISRLEIDGCKRWYVRVAGGMLYSHLVFQGWALQDRALVGGALAHDTQGYQRHQLPLATLGASFFEPHGLW